MKRPAILLLCVLFAGGAFGCQRAKVKREVRSNVSMSVAAQPKKKGGFWAYVRRRAARGEKNMRAKRRLRIQPRYETYHVKGGGRNRRMRPKIFD